MHTGEVSGEYSNLSGKYQTSDDLKQLIKDIDKQLMKLT